MNRLALTCFAMAINDIPYMPYAARINGVDVASRAINLNDHIPIIRFWLDLHVVSRLLWPYARVAMCKRV